MKYEKQPDNPLVGWGWGFDNPQDKEKFNPGFAEALLVDLCGGCDLAFKRLSDLENEDLFYNKFHTREEKKAIEKILEIRALKNYIKIAVKHGLGGDEPLGNIKLIRRK